LLIGSGEGKGSGRDETAGVETSSLLCRVEDSWLRVTTMSFSCCRRRADCSHEGRARERETESERGFSFADAIYNKLGICDMAECSLDNMVIWV